MGIIKDKFESRTNFNSLNTLFEFPDLPQLYTPYYLDSWYVSPFYGKVDTYGIPIMPNLSAIKYCTTGKDKEQVLSLSPVRDFFAPLREQYLTYAAAGSINKSGPFFKKDIPPVNGFVNGHSEYEEKIKARYSEFVQNLINTNKINLIQNINDFINELLIYIKTTNSYLTRAGYVESTDYSILHTGLAVEIFKGDTNDDDLRTKFFEDGNYDSFLELCSRNNLKPDRQIPWRVYVDVRTKPKKVEETTYYEQLDFKTQIKKYIPQFEDNLQLFFDIFYTKTIPYDTISYPYFTEFKNIINSYYSSFLSSYPTYTKYNINECGLSNVLKKQRNQLATLKEEDYLKLYLQFRVLEIKLDKDLDTNKKIVEDCVYLFRTYSEKFNSLVFPTTYAIKYFTDSLGTLAYRAPSLIELDSKE